MDDTTKNGHLAEMMPIRLARLTPPLSRNTISKEIFGQSREKYLTACNHFRFAQMPDGIIRHNEPQKRIDGLYENREALRIKTINVRFHFKMVASPSSPPEKLNFEREFIILATENTLDAFEQAVRGIENIYALSKDHPVLVSGFREFMADMAQDSEENIFTLLHGDNPLVEPSVPTRDTVGWMDMNSGSMILKSSGTVQNMKRLLGLRDVNYPK